MIPLVFIISRLLMLLSVGISPPSPVVWCNFYFLLKCFHLQPPHCCSEPHYEEHWHCQSCLIFFSRSFPQWTKQRSFHFSLFNITCRLAFCVSPWLDDQCQEYLCHCHWYCNWLIVSIFVSVTATFTIIIAITVYVTFTVLKFIPPSDLWFTFLFNVWFIFHHWFLSWSSRQGSTSSVLTDSNSNLGHRTNTSANTSSAASLLLSALPTSGLPMATSSLWRSWWLKLILTMLTIAMRNSGEVKIAGMLALRSPLKSWNLALFADDL